MAPNPIPILSLQLQPSQLQAKVTQIEKGTVVFNGTATVDQLRFMSCTVTLQGVVNTGWPNEINPTTMEFSGSGSQTFSVTVVVPPATSALLTGNVIISGSCKVPGLAPVVASCSAVVTVSQYLKVAMGSSDPTIELGKDEEGMVILFVDNHGNGQTTVYPSIVQAPSGIGVLFDANHYTIEQDESENITMAISVGERAPSGQHEIIVQLEATTTHGDRELVGDFSLTLIVPSAIQTIGVLNLVVIIVCVTVVSTMVILWRKGKLPGRLRWRVKEKTSPDVDEASKEH
jgi:hypothetical protein